MNKNGIHTHTDRQTIDRWSQWKVDHDPNTFQYYGAFFLHIWYTYKYICCSSICQQLTHTEIFELNTNGKYLLQKKMNYESSKSVYASSLRDDVDNVEWAKSERKNMEEHTRASGNHQFNYFEPIAFFSDYTASIYCFAWYCFWLSMLFFTLNRSFSFVKFVAYVKENCRHAALVWTLGNLHEIYFVQTWKTHIPDRQRLLLSMYIHLGYSFCNNNLNLCSFLSKQKKNSYRNFNK